MTKLTERENYLKTLYGEQPEWVPEFFSSIIVADPIVFQNKPTYPGDPNKKFKDFLGMEHNDRERYEDMLGVEFTQTIDGPIPTPGNYLITDITKWREQVHALPDLDQFDFKAMADQFFSIPMFNRREKAVIFMGGGDVFMNLMNAMGFEEGLCAMVEEPEAVKDFFNELTDWKEKKLRLSLPYYKPDLVCVADDVATMRDLFFSPEVYRDIIKPCHQRLVSACVENGARVEVHCCGHCEALIPDWVEMGITSWQPAQPVNDLKGIKAKYGNSFVFNGGWDTKGAGGLNGASEEVVRKSVRDTIDTLAPGGGLVFWDGGMTGGQFQKFEWTADEAKKYGKEFYRR
jgi:hypothetical protein